MVARVTIVFLGLIAAGLLAVTMRLPGSALDLYFYDTYVAVSKASLIGLILVVFVIPLVVIIIRRARSTHQ